MALTVAELRRQAVTGTLFTPVALFPAIERLGFVQMDPICAPARAQELILRHRVPDYRVGDLERQYPNLDLIEDNLHLYGVMPARMLRIFHPRTAAFRVEQEHPGLAEAVLAFVRANAPADFRSVDTHFDSPRTLGNWGRDARATTKILEILHYRGLLRVVRRQGNVRWYAAAPPVVPEGDPQERLRQLVLLLARLHAPVTVQSLKLAVGWLRWGAPSLPDRAKAVEKLLESGDLIREKVDGVTYVWPADGRKAGDAPQLVRLLAPFDPVVWDRNRFEHLWGWPYRLEAYTPAAERRFGRYALPLLWTDRVIGWANVAYRQGRITADLGYVDGRPPAGPEFKRELEAELARLEAFMQGRT